MAVPAMSTRLRTSALRMPSTQPAIRTLIIGYTTYIFWASYRYIVLYIGNLLFEHFSFVKLILSLQFEFKRCFSKCNCVLDNLYVMHIDELERSMYHF